MKFDLSYPASERRNMHCSITVFLRVNPKSEGRLVVKKSAENSLLCGERKDYENMNNASALQ